MPFAAPCVIAIAFESDFKGAEILWSRMWLTSPSSSSQVASPFPTGDTADAAQH
jgi:hypothetical protein